MKGSSLAIFIGVVLAVAVALAIKIRTHAEETFETPNLIRCTCYCDTGITASGQQTRRGIVAGKREWMGKVAALYAVDPETGGIGDFIGYYEFLDTGAGMDTDGDGYGDSILNGISIDVWQPTEQECWDWVNTYKDYVYMQIIEGVG